MTDTGKPVSGASLRCPKCGNTSLSGETDSEGVFWFDCQRCDHHWVLDLNTHRQQKEH
jgi:endogenous inhibitor of DNA gyrase (YacG/DUF329 family)